MATPSLEGTEHGLPYVLRTGEKSPVFFGIIWMYKIEVRLLTFVICDDKLKI